MYNVRVNDEFKSADVKAAEESLETLDKLIMEENYLLQQILSKNSTSLFWKQMPEKAFTHKKTKSMPDFKVFKNRIAVFLGDNVVNYKLKALRSGTVRTPGPSSISISSYC